MWRIGSLALRDGDRIRPLRMRELKRGGSGLPTCLRQSGAGCFKTGDTSYGIFDTFETEDARQDHLHGEIPRALAQVAQDLLAGDPDIRMVDVIAVK